MKPAPFAYARPRTLDEALSVLSKTEGVLKIMAGGQSLGPMLNLRLAAPDLIVDISGVSELKRAETRGGELVLGACVTHADIATPLLMKIPRISEGEDPAAIVSFEMEQQILPRLKGPHVPACFGVGDFDRLAYVVMERVPGTTLYPRLPELPALP